MDRAYGCARSYTQVVEEISGGASQRIYAYGLNRISQSQGSGTRFFGYYGHGNVRLLTDGTSGVTDRYDYDAFGNIISRTGTTSNLYQYSGEQNDPNLGLTYLRTRYVDVLSGRFRTMDEFEGYYDDPGSQNKYIYVQNNPESLSDPSGRIGIESVVVAVAVVGILAATAPQVFAAGASGGEPNFDIHADIDNATQRALKASQVPDSNPAWASYFSSRPSAFGSIGEYQRFNTAVRRRFADIATRLPRVHYQTFTRKAQKSAISSISQLLSPGIRYCSLPHAASQVEAVTSPSLGSDTILVCWDAYQQLPPTATGDPVNQYSRAGVLIHEAAHLEGALARRGAPADEDDYYYGRLAVGRRPYLAYQIADVYRIFAEAVW